MRGHVTSWAPVIEIDSVTDEELKWISERLETLTQQEVQACYQRKSRRSEIKTNIWLPEWLILNSQNQYFCQINLQRPITPKFSMCQMATSQQIMKVSVFEGGGILKNKPTIWSILYTHILYTVWPLFSGARFARGAAGLFLDGRVISVLSGLTLMSPAFPHPLGLCQI